MLKYLFLILLVAEVASASELAGIGYPTWLFPRQTPPIAAGEGNHARFELLHPLFESHLQQAYLGSEIAKLMPQGGYIETIRLRTDANAGGGHIDEPLSGVQISLGTTQVAPNSLSPVFADNIRSELTVVREISEVSQIVLDLTGREDTGHYIYINLAKPFFYDPHVGNLLLDLQTKDARFGVALDYQTYDLDGSMGSVWGYGYNSPMPDKATVMGVGFITVFGLRPVPEPSVVGLAALGGAALLVALRKKPLA